MSLIAEWKKELDGLSKLKKGPEKTLLIASVIAEALQSIERDPILVGGAAVEFYTLGKYSTADIDMVTDGGKDLAKLMLDLGFEKIGKDFVDRKRGFYIEFPGSHLGAGEKVRLVEVGKRHLRIISIEDLIVDRLCAYKFWQSGIDGVNALLLLEQPVIDSVRLIARCHAGNVEDALKVVKFVQEQAIRKKLSPQKVSNLLESEKKKLI